MSEPHATPPPSSSQENLARRHRRMQLGLGLDEDARAERIAARTPFDDLEGGSLWLSGLGIAVAAACFTALGIRFLWDDKVPPPPLAPAPVVALAPSSPPRAMVITAPASAPTPVSYAAPSRPVPAAVPPEPSPTLVSVSATALPSYPASPPAPAPDYAVHDRRIVELKQESDALDDFARDVRANPGVNHWAEPGHYVYEAWRYRRNGWTDSESLNKFLKWLDQRRDEVRREKWRLEGR